MKSLRIIAITALLALTACASGTLYKHMAPTVPQVKEGQGRIYLYRSTRISGVAVQPRLHVDGADVGRSQPGGFFYVDVAAGNHELSTSADPDKKLAVAVASGETKYVKCTAVFGARTGSVDLDVVSEAEAMKELPELGFAGDTK